MQLSALQVEECEEEPLHYMAVMEEDGSSVRASAELLLDELQMVRACLIVCMTVFYVVPAELLLGELQMVRYDSLFSSSVQFVSTHHAYQVCCFCVCMFREP